MVCRSQTRRPSLTHAAHGGRPRQVFLDSTNEGRKYLEIVARAIQARWPLPCANNSRQFFPFLFKLVILTNSSLFVQIGLWIVNFQIHPLNFNCLKSMKLILFLPKPRINQMFFFLDTWESHKNWIKANHDFQSKINQIQKG